MSIEWVPGLRNNEKRPKKEKKIVTLKQKALI